MLSPLVCICALPAPEAAPSNGAMCDANIDVKALSLYTVQQQVHVFLASIQERAYKNNKRLYAAHSPKQGGSKRQTEAVDIRRCRISSASPHV